MRVAGLVRFYACLVLILILILTPSIRAFRYQISLFLQVEMIESDSGTELPFLHQWTLVLT